MVLKKTLTTRLQSILATTTFFYVTLAFFVSETLWILLSGRYSMAFDENTHLSIIRLYAHKLSPFWSQPPPGPATYGAVSRDPSYLYHYLMSFPYRLLEQFVHSETWQVIILRLFSLGFFVIGIILMRKVLLKTKASRAMVHTVLAFFVLTPVVPFLAAQINYDNLMFPLVGVTLLLALGIIDDLQAKRLPAGRLLLLIAVGLLACLVKYSFLPIFAAIFLWLGWLIVKRLHDQGWAKVWLGLRTSFGALSRSARLCLIVLAVLSGGLFFERYGINMLRYHTPTPECDQVLSVDECMYYGPWVRNYRTYQDYIRGKLPVSDLAPVHKDPVSYTIGTWLRIMHYQLFFTINGEADQFSIGAPLPLPRYLALGLGLVGAALVLFWQKYLRRSFRLSFLVFVAALYIAALWLQEYADFRHLGLAVAIQARYLVPVLLIMYLCFGLAYARTLQKLPRAKILLTSVALAVLLLEGGGAMAFIARSGPAWYWPSGPAPAANRAVQGAMKKFVIGS